MSLTSSSSSLVMRESMVIDQRRAAGAAGGGGAASNYLRHNLGKYPSDEYFNNCCERVHADSDGVACMDEICEALRRFSGEMNAAIGPKFPCYEDGSECAPSSEPLGAVRGPFGGESNIGRLGQSEASSAAFLDIPSVSVRPSSVGDPVKRIPLGYEVNEMLQSLLHETPLCSQLEHLRRSGASSANSWGKAKEARKRAEDVLMPFAVAAYRRHIGNEDTSASHQEVDVQLAPLKLQSATSKEVRWYGDRHAAVLVHLWRSGAAANNAFRTMQWVQQSIADYALEGLHTVVSVMYCLHGEYVQVFALPPLQGLSHGMDVPCSGNDVVMDDENEANEGPLGPGSVLHGEHINSNIEVSIGSSSATTGTSGTTSSIITAPRTRQSSALELLCTQLRDVLMLPLQLVNRATGSGNKVMAPPRTLRAEVGADGRVYLLDVLSLAYRASAQLCSDCFVDDAFVPNGELIEHYVLHAAGALGQFAATSSQLPTMHRYVVDTCFPRVVDEFLVIFHERDKAAQGVPALLRDQVLNAIMKQHAIPARYMYELLAYARQRHSSSQSNRVVSPTSAEAPNMPPSNTSEDTSSQSSAPTSGGVGKGLRALMDVCTTELVARTTKDMVLHDVRTQATLGFIGEQEQLEAINRVLRNIATKDVDFWTNHLTGVLRRKFHVPSDASSAWFIIGPTRVHIASVLKIVSSRTGAILLPERNRFEKFASARETGVFSALANNTPVHVNGSTFPFVSVFETLTKPLQLLYNHGHGATSSSSAVHSEKSGMTYSLCCAWETRNCLVACIVSYLIDDPEVFAPTLKLLLKKTERHAGGDASSTSSFHEAFQASRCARYLTQTAHIPEVGKYLRQLSFGPLMVGDGGTTDPAAAASACQVGFCFRVSTARGLLQAYINHRQSHNVASVETMQHLGRAIARVTASTTVAVQPQCVMQTGLQDVLYRLINDVIKSAGLTLPPRLAANPSVALSGGSSGRLPSPGTSGSHSQSPPLSPRGAWASSVYSAAASQPLGVPPLPPLLIGILGLVSTFGACCAQQKNTSQLLGDLSIKTVAGCLINPDLFPPAAPGAGPGATVAPVPSSPTTKARGGATMQSPSPTKQSVPNQSPRQTSPSTAAASQSGALSPPAESGDRVTTINHCEARRLLATLVFNALTVVRQRKGPRHVHSIVLTYALAFTSLQLLAANLSLLNAAQGPTNNTNSNNNRALIEYIGSVPLLQTIQAGSNAVRKILEKTIAMSAKQQAQSATTPVPSSVLYKIHVILQRVGSDARLAAALVESPPQAPGFVPPAGSDLFWQQSQWFCAAAAGGHSGDELGERLFDACVAATLLRDHVAAFAPTLCSAYCIERIGRGFVDRRQTGRRQLKKNGARVTQAPSTGPPTKVTPPPTSPVAPATRSSPVAASTAPPSAVPHPPATTTTATPSAALPLPTITFGSPSVVLSEAPAEGAPSPLSSIGASSAAAAVTRNSSGTESNGPAPVCGETAPSPIVIEVEVFSPPPTRGSPNLRNDSPLGSFIMERGAGEAIGSPTSFTECNNVDGEEGSGRASIVHEEVAERAAIQVRRAEVHNALLCRQHDQRISVLEAEEAASRLAIIEDTTLWQSDVTEFLATFWKRFYDIDLRLLPALVAVDEVSARADIQQAEANGVAFLASVRERAAMEAAVRERARTRDETQLRAAGNMSPTWDQERLAQASPLHNHSPAFSPTHLVADSLTSGLPRAPSPLAAWATRRPTKLAATAAASSGTQVDPIEAPQIAFVSVDPLTSTELDAVLGAWRLQQQSIASPARAAGGDATLQEAGLQLTQLVRQATGDHHSGEKHSGGAGNVFGAWLEAERAAQMLFAPARRMTFDAEPFQTEASRTLALQECTWQALVDQAVTAVAEQCGGGCMPTELDGGPVVMDAGSSSVVVHRWTSRIAARAYLRAMRAIGHACREVLHVSPTQFIVPVALKFACATSLVTVTYCWSRGTTEAPNGAGQPASPTTASGGQNLPPSRLAQSVTNTLNALFQPAAKPDDSTTLAYVRVIPLPDGSGRCAVLPTEALLDVVVFPRVSVGDASLAIHAASLTHLPDAFTFSMPGDEANRIPHVVARCAAYVKGIVVKSGTLSSRAMVSAAHRHGVPICYLWHVVQSDALRDEAVPTKAQENVMSSTISTLVARALKQLILVAADMERSKATSVVPEAVEAHGADEDGCEDVAHLQAATLLCTVRILRTFSRSTTMLQTYVSAVLSEHFNASMAAVNTSLVSVTAVVHEVCGALGLRLVDRPPTSPGAAAVVSNSRSTYDNFVVAIDTTPVLRAATAPRRQGFLRNGKRPLHPEDATSSARVPFLVDREREAQELLRSILVLKSNRASPLVLFSVASKAVYCDVDVTSRYPAAKDILTQAPPVSSLMVHRNLLCLPPRPSGEAAAASQEVGASVVKFMALANAALLDDVSALVQPDEQLFLAQQTLEWLQDELRVLKRHAQQEHAATALSGRVTPSAGNNAAEQLIRPNWDLYRFALRVVGQEENSVTFQPIPPRVFPLVEALVNIFKLHIEHDVRGAADGGQFSFALQLAQRELGILVSLVHILSRETFFADIARFFLVQETLAHVLRPCFEWMLFTDQSSTVCKAYQPLVEAATALIKRCLETIAGVPHIVPLPNDGNEHVSVQTAMMMEKAQKFLFGAPQYMFAPLMFVGAKGSLACATNVGAPGRNERELELTVLTLQLQDFMRALLNIERPASPPSGIVTLQASPLTVLIHPNEHGATKYAAAFQRLARYILLHTPVPLPHMYLYHAMACCGNLPSLLSTDVSLGHEGLAAASSWIWVPVSSSMPTVEDGLLEVAHQHAARAMLYHSMHTVWMQCESARLCKLLADESARVEAQQTNMDHLAYERLRAVVDAFESECLCGREQITVEWQTIVAELFANCRDTAEWLEEEKSAKQLHLAITLTETRDRVVLANTEDDAWTMLLSGFYDALRLLDSEAAERDGVLDDEDDKWIAIMDLVDEESKWSLNLQTYDLGARQQDETSPSTARNAQLRHELGPFGASSPDNVDMPSRRGDESSPSGAVIAIRPAGAREGSRQGSRHGSRQGSRQRPVIPLVTPRKDREGSASSPSARRRPVSDGYPSFDQLLPADPSAINDGGLWQRVATPRNPTIGGGGGAGDDFIPLPPPGANNSDDDSDNEANMVILAARASPDRPVTPQLHQEHPSFFRSPGPSEHAVRPKPRPSSTGLPPRANKQRTPVDIDQRKILPLEYTDAYRDKLVARSEALRATHGTMGGTTTCGTQTGMTPPPTPPMLHHRAPPIASMLHATTTTAASELEKTLDEAAASKLTGLMPALDILYRSAQQQHVMGQALVVVFFMDIQEAGRDSLPKQQKHIRVPSALSRRRRFCLSETITTMDHKVKELEAQSALYLLEQCELDEGRRRGLVTDDQLKSRNALCELEDTNRLMIDERERERALALSKREAIMSPKKVASHSPSAAHAHQTSCDDDEELLGLRLAARAYMTGGAKHLRPSIAGDGVFDSVARKAKLGSKKLGGSGHVNTATETLRKLQEELAALDPSFVPPHGRPPLPHIPSGAAAGRRGSPAQAAAATAAEGVQDAAAAATTTLSRGRQSSAGVRARPLSPGLPYLQKSKLTSPTLRPVVASLLPDRDFSRAALTLPPLTGPQSKALRTPFGLVLPETAHAVVEVARLKQEAELEIIRETYSDSEHIRSLRNFHGGQLPPLRKPTGWGVRGGDRPNSAQLKTTLPSDLPQSFTNANARTQLVIIVQSFLRAYEARDARCRLAMWKIFQWLARILRRRWLRRRNLATAKLQRKNERAVASAAWRVWLGVQEEASALRRTANDLVWTSFERRVQQRSSIAVLCASNTRALQVRYWTRLVAHWKKQRSCRLNDSYALQCKRALLKRYFLDVWYASLVARHCQRIDTCESTTMPRSVDVSTRIVQSDALSRIARAGVQRLQQRYLSDWLVVYIRRAKKQEARSVLAALILKERRNRISNELDRVWCAAMLSSGWARKYFKPFYYELQRRVLAKRPELASLKWRHNAAGFKKSQQEVNSKLATEGVDGLC